MRTCDIYLDTYLPSFLTYLLTHQLFCYRRRSYTSPAKKISYEDDFHLPESGSLVQGVSVDPHSAVFGKHGQRLDIAAATEKSQLSGLPDVTAAATAASPGYYHKNSATGFSTFQSPTTAASAPKEPLPTLWQNSVGGE